MNILKKALAITLSVCLLCTVASPAFATGDTSNFNISVSATSVAVGDKVQVSLSHQDMTLAAFAAIILFDTEAFECTAIVGADAEYPEDVSLQPEDAPFPKGLGVSTVEEANKNGAASCYLLGMNDTTYRASDDFMTVTFTAKKATSQVVFTLEEDCTVLDPSAVPATKPTAVPTEQPATQPTTAPTANPTATANTTTVTTATQAPSAQSTVAPTLVAQPTDVPQTTPSQADPTTQPVTDAVTATTSPTNTPTAGADSKSNDTSADLANTEPQTDETAPSFAFAWVLVPVAIACVGVGIVLFRKHKGNTK